MCVYMWQPRYPDISLITEPTARDISGKYTFHSSQSKTPLFCKRLSLNNASCGNRKTQRYHVIAVHQRSPTGSSMCRHKCWTRDVYEKAITRRAFSRARGKHICHGVLRRARACSTSGAHHPKHVGATAFTDLDLAAENTEGKESTGDGMCMCGAEGFDAELRLAWRAAGHGKKGLRGRCNQ